MRLKSLTKILAGIALFGVVTVHAQTPAPAPAAPAAPAPVTSTLTVPQMEERIAALQTQIDDDAQYIRHLQDVARKEKDVVKLTCVNDRLVELKAQQNIFDQANQQFQSTSTGGGADAARPSYDELTSTADQVQRLRGDAEACIGVPDLYKQESDVDVTHPAFPDDPTTTDPFSPEAEIDTVEPPGYASPFA